MHAHKHVFHLNYLVCIIEKGSIFMVSILLQYD